MVRKIMAAIRKALKTALRTIWKAGECAFRFVCSDWDDWEGFGGDESAADTSSPEPQPQQQHNYSGPSIASKVVDAAATVGSAALNATGNVVNAVASVIPKISLGASGGPAQMPMPSSAPSAATQQISAAIDGLLDLEDKVARDPRGLTFMYCMANSAFRQTMDLSPLEPNLRRWLGSLSDHEYTVIRDAGLRATLDHIDGIKLLDGVLPAPQPIAGSRADRTATVRKNLRGKLADMASAPTLGADVDYDLRDMHAA